MTTTRAGAFLDTNVWLYAFITGQDPKKQQQAGALITS
ncbi:PIN domain-containing protein [Candidatus Chloroploca mongolica]|nr:PIN domain-containing protein [Candidatus Chloroploca mongolica]